MNSNKLFLVNDLKRMKMIVMFLVCIMLNVHAFSETDFIHCKEKVTAIHVHSNGHIYFNTEGVCSPKWCEIGWSDQSEAHLNRAYSALLAARTADRKVTFAWSKSILASCDEQFDERHMSPEWFDY